MYALVDCNNFYASCERLFQPWLNNLPIVVLSNNDGCVIARSQEAKDLGIKMGEPAFKLRNLFIKNDVISFSSNYTLYGDISNRVMQLLSSFTPEIEIYSIDEAFLSFYGMNLNLIEYAIKIRDTILKNLGIPVGIGIGPTKTLAKAANYFAKKDKNNNGVFYISTNRKLFSLSNTTLTSFGYFTDFLKKLEVGEIWGIGRKYSSFLNKNGIYNAWQFTQADDLWIKKHMSVVGLRTKKELLGMSCIPIELQPPPKKAIATTRSFGSMVDDLETLKQAISKFSSRCAYKLRRQESICNALMVFIVSNKHRQELEQYSKSIVVNLNMPTSSTIELVKASLEGLTKIFKKGIKYKKAGVILYDIISKNIIQTSLFDNINRIKHDNLMESVDKTNFKIGREKLKLAACGNDRKWRLKREKLSRSYTTRWDELININ